MESARLGGWEENENENRWDVGTLLGRKSKLKLKDRRILIPADFSLKSCIYVRIRLAK